MPGAAEWDESVISYWTVEQLPLESSWDPSDIKLELNVLLIIDPERDKSLLFDD